MLLLEYGLLPTEIMFMEKAIEYMLKAKKLAHWLPRSTWQWSKKIQTTCEGKNLGIDECEI